MNNRFAFALVLVILLASSMMAPQIVKAGPRTIIVPDDYGSVNAALNGAADGDTIFVRKGTYNEVLEVTKSVSLVGENGESVINGKSAGTVVVIRHDNVTFTGFTVLYDSTANSPDPFFLHGSRVAGVHVLDVKYCNVSGNTISDSGAGIWLYYVQMSIVAGNSVVNSDYGMRVEASTNNIIENNDIVNGWGGLWLISSGQNTFRGNSMSGNTRNLGISGDAPSSYINNFDDSNRVDGKPVYYWLNAQNKTVPSDAGAVILLDSSDVTIQGLRLAKNQQNIILVGCRNTLVIGNSITANGEGITTYNSLGDRIIQNNVNAEIGISVDGEGAEILRNTISAGSVGVNVNGSYQTVADNTIDTSQEQGYMMKCAGSYTNITRNRFTGTTYSYATIDGPNNLFYKNVMTGSYQLQVSSGGNIIFKNDVPGITVSDGSGNVVCGNRITNGLGLGVGGHNNVYFANQIENNYYVGVSVTGTEVHSSNNTLYHNNIINNKEQVKNYGNPTNFWDNGVEGNYWSDYNGTDANGDGIGDTPHRILSETFNQNQGGIVTAETGQDRYPLMAPFNIDIVNLQLPEWTYELPQPSTSPTPSSTPPPTPSPTLTPSPTPSSSTTQISHPSPSPNLSTSPSTSATEQPSKAQPQPELKPAELLYATGAAATIITFIAVAAVFVWKRKRQDG